MKFNKSMFGQIQDQLKKTSVSGGYGNLLRYSQEGVYTLKLLYNPECENNQIKHYMEHGWESTSTGSYLSTVSLQTFGERDPISEAFWRGIKSDDEDIKERYKKLSRRDKNMINVLVVNDPNNQENNGKIKVLKYSKQIKDVIDAAIMEGGDDYDEFGPERVFGYDSGVFLQIKAVKKGPFTSFDKSKFITKSKDFDLDEDEFYALYENLFNLEEEVPEVKSFDELEEILYEHWFTGDNLDLLEEYQNARETAGKKQMKQTPKTKRTPVNTVDEDEDIPMDFDDEDTPPKKSVSAKKTKSSDDAPDEDMDADFSELLAEWD